MSTPPSAEPISTPPGRQKGGSAEGATGRRCRRAGRPCPRTLPRRRADLEADFTSGMWLAGPLRRPLAARTAADCARRGRGRRVGRQRLLGDAAGPRTLTAAERVVFVLREVFEFLAPDIVLLTDGGGVVRAALAPVIGADGASHVRGRIAAAATPAAGPLARFTRRRSVGRPGSRPGDAPAVTPWGVWVHVRGVALELVGAGECAPGLLGLCICPCFVTPNRISSAKA